MSNWGWTVCIVIVILYLLAKIIDSCCLKNKGK